MFISDYKLHAYMVLLTSLMGLICTTITGSIFTGNVIIVMAITTILLVFNVMTRVA